MKYQTDIRAGEPDILTPLKAGRLTIKSLDGAEVIYSQDAPEGGWTHELLTKVQPAGIEYGADTFINGEWIGSTEV